MTKHATSVATTAWAVAWLFLTTSNATTVIPPRFEQMTDRADLVFVGEALSSQSEWRSVGTNRAIFTLVEFETHDVLKGDAGTSVKHARPGIWDMMALTRLV
jgi:hypothetical protein